MYAAAGGASIANRRKQKRLQLNKRVGEGTIPSRLKPVPAGSSQHHYHHPSKFARPHVVPPSSTPQPQPQPQPPSSAFHPSIDRRRHVEKCQQVAPVSPIQFPISPPPLSLESPSSVTCATKSNNFPFPPPSILDLRVSPSSLELQVGRLFGGNLIALGSFHYISLSFFSSVSLLSLSH